MLRPLLVDVSGFLLPPILGTLAFLVGRTFQRRGRALRAFFILVAILAVAAGILLLTQHLPRDIRVFLSWLGGGTILLSWAALLLLGIVVSVPNRSLSTGFIATLAAVAGCLILIEASGQLAWRFFFPEAWQRRANADGLLQQTSGTTCSPTAAVMLLAQYGIPSSEGEMAYLAGTSLFGTDAESIARALRRKVEPMGWQVVAEETNYETCHRRSVPFVAHVQGASTGHAMLVEHVLDDHVEVIDPADGRRTSISRNDFENIWDGTAIFLARGLGK